MTENPHRSELKKILGLAFGIALVVGNVIGAGILATPGMVAQYVQHSGLIIACWVFGGIYMFSNLAQTLRVIHAIPLVIR